jgi:hypothetical protein
VRARQRIECDVIGEDMPLLRQRSVLVGEQGEWIPGFQGAGWDAQCKDHLLHF